MGRIFLLTGAIFGFLGVAAGAFGAHALQGKISAERLQVFEVAVRYQMYHALALLVVGYLAGRFPVSALSLGGWLLVAGTVVFSGTLYLLVLTGSRWWGAVTPLGGLALLGGWLCLAWAVWSAAGPNES